MKYKAFVDDISKMWATQPNLTKEQLNGIKEAPMSRAIWNDAVIAESDRCEVVEGNQYFPPDTVQRALLRESTTHTTCPWKGLASYYDVVVDGKVNRDAAWYYPEPSEAAKQIRNYIAFWRGVTVEVA